MAVAGTAFSGTITTFRGLYPAGAMTKNTEWNLQKVLATILHGMEGTPYVYQGEELGMTNVRFESIEQYQDIEIRNMYRSGWKRGMQRKISMDLSSKGPRQCQELPMQWDDTENAGFTTGTPWLGVNPKLYRKIKCPKPAS